MININETSFQDAWAKAFLALENNGGQDWSLVVQVRNPTFIDTAKHDVMEKFAKKHMEEDAKTGKKKFIGQNQVAYTIFPDKIYTKPKDRNRLYKAYGRYFRQTRKMSHRGWGTYFERMTKYLDPNGQHIDQLGDIIDKINNRDVNYGASNFIVIPYPHRDRNKLMGAPCLNYLTVQVENVDRNTKKIHLLAVYRNHDFTVRAYGNYLGLCNLLKYICRETDSEVGLLTCISSHAQINGCKRELSDIAKSFVEQ